MLTSPFVEIERCCNLAVAAVEGEVEVLILVFFLIGVWY